MDELAIQGGIAAGSVYLLQWLKNARWFPWVSQHTGALNKALGIIVALATSAGVKYALSPVAATGGYHLVVDLPSLNTMGIMLAHAAAQLAFQEVLYHTSVKDTIGGMHTTASATGEVSGAAVSVAVSDSKETAPTK